MNSNHLLEQSSLRAKHFAETLLWFEKELSENSEFQNQFQIFVDTLVSCRNNDSSHRRQAYFIAVGKSSYIAQLLVGMLASVGILARFVHPTEAFHGDLGVIGKDDPVFLISNNGQSQEILQLLPELSMRSVKLFGITAKSQSPIATHCHHVCLLPPYEEFCPLKTAPITSTIAMLALGQLLVAATIEKSQFSIEEYARNHPGGAIGKKIHTRVEHIMQKGQQLPLVTHTASFHKVISCLTQFAMGALLIEENEIFTGLIAERDIRLAMEKWGPQVFDLTAKDIMNTNPITIRESELAVEAMRLMSEREVPLNLLPVINSQGKAVGLIRRYDLLSSGFRIS